MKSAEDRYRLSQLDFLTADKVFDARWAMTLLDEAMARLSEEYAAQGKVSMFETLKPFIDPINSNAKKRAGWEGVDSDYLFTNFLQRAA